MTETRSPIRTCLISGFLGAGKTTFILDQLKHAAGKVAVFVNEFGELGVDGALVRSRGGVDVVELPGGCICCTGKEGLVAGVAAIAGEIRPELLLIEPSGVAELSEMLALLTGPELAGVILLDAAVTVVDASTFLEYADPDAFGPFFHDQVRNADLVVVNKADLVAEEELLAVEGRIGEIAPDALVVRSTFCRMERSLPAGRSREVFPAGGGGPGLSCVSVVPGELSVARLTLFLAEVAAGRFGRIVRGKGFVPVRGKGMQNLQIAGRRVALEDAPEELSPRLTLIGDGLDGGRLREFFGAEPF